MSISYLAEGEAPPPEHARGYGIDIGLLQTALERTPAERLALLERNVEFLRAARRHK